MSPDAVVPKAATAVVDVLQPEPVDFSQATIWRMIGMHRGVPLTAFWMASPGRLDDAEAFLHDLFADARATSLTREAADRLAGRMGVRRRTTPVRCSVVVCTHRRENYLPALLEAVGRLDPAPHEVIVVDNDPGDQDVRHLVEGSVARYVREDARGLDNARNAGARAATGEVVGFTDDDCIPPPGWLANIPGLFSRPDVVAVTAPAFSYEFEQPTQLTFEFEGGFNRGFRRRVHDWTTTSPLRAAQVGVGNNMFFRRRLLQEIGGFPPELDLGTPTRAGGDLYVLCELLRTGHRVVYDPGTWLWHRHRRDQSTLTAAFVSYGTGATAFLLKCLIEDRELSAVAPWAWFPAHLGRAAVRRALGTATDESLRSAWDYMWGAVHGAGAWRRSRRMAREAGWLGGHPAGRPEAPDPGNPVTAPARDVGSGLRATVIVPTVGRPEALRRCLAGLQAQDVPPGSFEVVVVDDAPPSVAAADLPPDTAPHWRLERTGGVGAAAARNAGARTARGDLLVFMDDDLVPEPGFVGAHLSAHDEQRTPVAVIGPTPPRPPSPGLAAMAAALWWEQHLVEQASAPRLAFSDFLSGNSSLSRALFEQVGGFAEELGRLRREDWLFGAALDRAGIPLVHADHAVAHHEFHLTTAQRLRGARREGWGDVLLLREHPELEAALPAAPETPAPSLRRLGLALRRPRGESLVTGLLAAMERSKLRGPWFRLFSAAQWAAYVDGRAQAGTLGPGKDTGHWTLSVEALGDEPVQLRRGSVPAIEVRVGGSPLSTVPVPLGRLTTAVAERVAEVATAATAASTPRPARRAPAAIDVVAALDPADAPAGWERALPRLRASTADWAIVTFGADPGPAFTTELEEVLDGDAVAVAIGGCLEPGRVPNTTLTSRAIRHERLSLGGPPALYCAFSTRHLAVLGEPDAALARHGMYAPALAFLERAADWGSSVLYRDVPDINPQEGPGGSPWRARDWQRHRARGAVAAGSGDTLDAVGTIRGTAPLLRWAVRERRGVTAVLVAAGGYAHGVLGAAVARRRSVG